LITNTGKSIIGKYLLGQAPAYASFIAVGCGPTPLQTGDVSNDFATKENLDFEMFRVPISSRGFVNENGTNKIVLTAELPTEERYEISEIGLYSAGSNPSAGSYDSKTVFSFTTGEAWQYQTTSSSSLIPTQTESLDSPQDDNIISVASPVFQTNADNPIFYEASRASRYERCRFLNNTIIIQGNEANLTISEDSGPTLDHFVVEEGSNYIKLTGANVDFTKNSLNDELRLAFSLINKNGESLSIPDTIRILVDFSSTDGSEFARFESEINQGSSGNLENSIADFETNRYFVVSKKINELYTSANFTWDVVTTVKIYVCVLVEESGPNLVPSEDYYIGLDALRLENISTVNPLYGLTGYTIIKNDNVETIIKSPNTQNYIEFRFSIGVT
jgi:hypothetical protein